MWWVFIKGEGGFILFFVKLDFEIAVDQQTKTHNRTFEVVPDSGCPPVSAGQPRPYLVNLWLNFAKSPLHAQKQCFRVATEHINKVLSKSDKNWPSYEQNTICPYLGIRNKYYRFWPINWVNIHIFEWNQLFMKGKPRLHILYEYQLISRCRATKRRFSFTRGKRPSHFRPHKAINRMT